MSKSDLDLWDELMDDVSPLEASQKNKHDTSVDDFDEKDDTVPLPKDISYFEAFAEGKISLEDIPDKNTPEPVNVGNIQEDTPYTYNPRKSGHNQPQNSGFVLAENSAHKLAGWRAGVDKKTIKGMAQGKVNPSLDVDLHGYTLLEAYAELRAFLAEAKQDGHKCVLIIHGKGRREGREMGAIKQNLAGFLAERAEVLAFHTAHRRHGGSGACYVLIKKAK